MALMLQPIAPHFSEELWHLLGNDTFSSAERWPEADGAMVSDDIEAGEELVDGVVSDAKQIIALMQKKAGKRAREARIVVADDWKRELINEVAKKKSVEKAMEAVRKDGKLDKEKAAKYLAVAGEEGQRSQGGHRDAGGRVQRTERRWRVHGHAAWVQRSSWRRSPNRSRAGGAGYAAEAQPGHRLLARGKGQRTTVFISARA